MGLVTIGLKSFKYAPLAIDGGPGTVFVSLGHVSKGTFAFNEEEPTKKLVEVEESSVPLKVKKRAGAKSITLSIADPDAAALSLIRGGTNETATGKKTYSEDTPVDLVGTIQIEPEEGFEKIQYNKVSIFGRFTGGLGSDQELLLSLTIDIEKPTKAGVKVWQTVEAAP